MRKNNAFMDLWLRADTGVGYLNPGQGRKIRDLCQRFFEKGRKYEQERQAVLSSVPNRVYTGDGNDAGSQG